MCSSKSQVSESVSTPFAVSDSEQKKKQTEDFKHSVMPPSAEKVTKKKDDTPVAKKEESSTEQKQQSEVRGEVLKDTRQAVDDYMPPVYTLGEEVIKSKKRSGFLFFRHDVEDSEELKDVKLKIEMVQSFLSNPMPPAQLDEEGGDLFKNELESVNLAINMMYNRLIESLDVWLERSDTLPDATKERIAMMTMLKEQVLKEEALFAQSLHEYRERMFEEAEEGDDRIHTWIDMLRYSREEKLDLDDKELFGKDDVIKTGGGTSDVLKIKQNGRYVYFKKEESIHTGRAHDIIGACAAEKQFEALDPDDVRMFQTAMYQQEQMAGRNAGRVYAIFRDLYKKEDIFEDIDPKASYLHHCLSMIKPAKQKAFQEFFKYSFKMYNQQTIAKHDAKIREGSNLSRRNVATSRLASLLGIGDMVAESRTARIKLDGETFHGNLMEEASGTTAGHVKAGRYSPKAEDQLFILHAFDLLCGQVDRHKGNYKFDTKSIPGRTEVTGIKCIDNDMSFGLMTYDQAQEGVCRLPKMHAFELYALPESFVRSVLALDASFAKLILADLLEPDELAAFGTRLVLFQNVLRQIERKRTADPNVTRDQDETLKKLYRDREVMKLYNFLHIRERLELGDIDKKTYFQGALLPTLEEIEERKAAAANRLGITREQLELVFRRAIR